VEYCLTALRIKKKTVNILLVRPLSELQHLVQTESRVLEYDTIVTFKRWTPGDAHRVRILSDCQLNCVEWLSIYSPRYGMDRTDTGVTLPTKGPINLGPRPGNMFD